MTQPRVLLYLPSLIVVAAIIGSCGVKGPPLPPVPAAAELSGPAQPLPSGTPPGPSPRPSQ